MVPIKEYGSALKTFSQIAQERCRISKQIMHKTCLIFKNLSFDGLAPRFQKGSKFFEMKHGKEEVLNDVQNNIQSSKFR